MPKRKLKRILEIENIVSEINFRDRGFKRALRYECKQKEVNFDRLRHWVDSNGIEVYVEVWKNYRDLLKEEGITSKLLIQAYHHIYVARYSNAIFQETINYLRIK